jgi:hypothetical protein
VACVVGVGVVGVSGIGGVTEISINMEVVVISQQINCEQVDKVAN